MSYLKASQFRRAFAKVEGKPAKEITVKHAVSHINYAEDGIIAEYKSKVKFTDLVNGKTYTLFK